MAKKKINNVVIKDEELTPTTIGIYSNKTKNPITLIILIIAFIAIAIYLPDIQTYINKVLGRESDVVESNNNNQNGGNANNPDDVEEVKKYAISTTTSVDAKEYSLSNIKLDGTSLSFTFTNKKDSAFDLNGYYLELFNDKGTFLGRIKVSNDSISSSGTKDFSFNIYSESSKFSFVLRTSNDYPDVALNYNEDKEATMSCRKDNHVYTYLFVDDNLSKITYIFNPTSENNPDYQSQLQEYYLKSNSLNLIQGVTSSISTTINSFYFTMNVELSKVNLQELNDDNVFKTNTEAKEVKFIEEAKGFTCTAN